MKKYIVITSINSKTESIEKLEEKKEWNIIIVGDKKSKFIKNSENLLFLSIEDQMKLGFEYSKIAPVNHYSRKNIGYLFAIKNGAEIIYDTDDDNIPKQNWDIPPGFCENKLSSKNKFINIYNYFSKEKLWPRGFPLDEIRKDNELKVNRTERTKIGLWQGLSDGEPDVDAIFRLIDDKRILFEDKASVYLEKKTYCPVNSQNTFWFREAFPLLYLPSTVSFRFTDILRGYLVQYILWQLDLVVGFTTSTNFQNRNIHDLMKDFKDEVFCYLNIKEIIGIMEIVSGDDAFDLILNIYIALQKKNFVKNEEIEQLKYWIKDFKSVTGKL